MISITVKGFVLFYIFTVTCKFTFMFFQNIRLKVPSDDRAGLFLAVLHIAIVKNCTPLMGNT